MIPLLNLLLNKNQMISLRSSELFSLIEKKIISELFDCEGDRRILQNILSTAPIKCDNISENLNELDNG